MHHGDDPQAFRKESELVQRLKKELDDKADQLMREHAKTLGLGATEDFPGGKINHDDGGEIKIGITAHEGKVILNFGLPTSWIGLDPEQAIELGRLLERRGKQIRQGKIT